MHNGEKSREEATTKKKLVVSIIGLFYTLVFLIFININYNFFYVHKFYIGNLSLIFFSGACHIIKVLESERWLIAY